MFRFSYAAKVGLIFLVAVFLLFMVLDTIGISLWKPKGTNDYYLTVVFESTKGLQKGYEVQYNGYWIGEVDDIRRHPFGDVEVVLRIFDKKKYKIHENAFFTIAQQSVFGANIVYISESKGGMLKAKSKKKDHTYIIEMPRGHSILHSDVYYHGEPIGTVVDIVKDPDNELADIVTIELDDDTAVDFNTDQSFVTSHRRETRMPLPGEEYDVEEVVVGRIDVYDRLKGGDVVEGTREPGPEDLVISANNLVESVGEAIGDVSSSLSELVTNINQVLTDLSGELTGEGEGTIKYELVASIHELEKGLKNIQALTENLNTILVDAQPRIEGIFENIEGITADIDEAVSGMSELVNDPELIESIKNTMANLEQATESVLSTIEEIEELVTDEQAKEDIKAILSGAREAIEQASETLELAKDSFDTFSETDIGGGFRVRYLPDPDRFASDLEFHFDPSGGKDFYYEVWLEDIGEADDFSFHLGYPFKDGWRGRFGVKRGHIGVGFDYEAGFFKIRGDFYDPNAPHFDIIGSWAIADDLDFTLGFEDIYEEDFIHFGIATEF